MSLYKNKLALVAALVGSCYADWQYASRPDLAPPKLNITIPAAHDVSPGYIFVGPYPGFDGVRAGPEQAAAYIFTNDGDLVWSSLGYYAGWVGNFQAVQYQGKPVLQAFQGYLDPFHGHGYGTPLLLDDHYRPVALVESLNHRLISIHEFKIVNEKTALVEIYQPTAIDLTPYGGTGEENWIADGIFQEFDIATGKLIFEGHTLDWASPAGESCLPMSKYMPPLTRIQQTASSRFVPGGRLLESMPVTPGTISTSTAWIKTTTGTISSRAAT
jgi:hypothetical protein